MTARVIIGTWQETVIGAGDDIVINFRNRQIARGALYVRMSRRKFRILSAMIVGGDRYWRMPDFIDALYGDRADGGPEFADKTVSVVLYHLRRREGPVLGIRLERVGGTCTYRLQVDPVSSLRVAA